MPQAVIKSMHYWEKRSASEEHQHKLVFLDQNKESYNWYNSELNDDAGNTKNNPSPLKDLPSELPEFDMETDYNETSAVKPEIAQSDTERIQEARTNSF